MQESKYDHENISKLLPLEVENSYRNIGEKSVAALKRKQRRTLKFIKAVYSSALNIKDRDKNFFLPVHFEWLCDNYYIIERELKYVYKSLAHVRRLPALGKKESSKYTPRIYAYLDRLAEKSEGEITGDMLTGYIKSAQSNGSYFYIDELRLAGVMLSAALCDRIYGVCVILKDYLDGKIKSVPDELAYSIGFSIKNLRFCEMYQFEKLFSECSKIDEIMSLDPSGYYPSMEKNTKDYYRYRLSLLAKKQRTDEISAAEEIVNAARENKRAALTASEKEKAIHEKKSHVGYFLTQRSSPKKLYFFSMAVLTFVITALTVYASKNILALLLVFPTWEFVKQVTDLTFSRLLGASPIPKLALASVPDDKKTLVCVTTLLFGEGKDDKLYERLELFYHGNKDKNIRFAVVGDLKDNKEEFTDQDGKIIEYAKSKIRALNEKYPDKFCLFMRRRVYSKTQGRFMGWERKRGAIIELVRFIKGKQTSIDVFEGEADFVNDIKYVITLDADTDLSLDSAKEMIAAMSHPNALPVYDADKKIVTDGYGIMQPKMGTELSAAAKTPFTRMLCGSGGFDIYESAAFDLYQEIYGEGNFCGKGIFDADIFYKTIDDAYPEEAVLSHDLLEGTRMRACLISDLELTDGIPKNAISYYDRLHRWIRGDVQALFFAFGKTKNADGETIENPISALSKFKLYDNVRRALTPVISVLFLFLALVFVPENIILPLAALSVLYIVFPFMANLCVIILTPSFQNVSKKFSSKVMTSIWQSLANVFFELSALGYKAFLSADAIVRSLVRRIITKKNLMSWQTASESEMKLTGLPLYLKKSAPSMILGVALITLAPFGLYKALGAMWVFFPFLAYYTGTETKNRNSSPTRGLEPEINQKEIKNYVTDMWKFYAATVKKQDNFLPPDNIQLYPTETTAHRTSPTNIGLYLLSCLAAHDYGIIDIKTLYAKIDATISTIERMEKWHGHLYNWYDTKKLEVIGSNFVSTVDSGNFCAALTALKEGLRDLPEFESLVGRIEKILDGTEFSFLYNPKRELFYIGYDGEKDDFGSNCYDLYMSEAKITSYFTIARREVPKKHWGRLSRTLIKDGGYMGLASWTGTAFEYFMANLLLPLYKDSLTYEANKFALREQIKRTAKYDGTEVWGISESGFYAFDFDMNYQYQAFGVQKLGLKRGLNKELVISPYSSFLALSISPRRAVNNLRRLKKIGMYGKYGFYEAADFTRSRVHAGVGIVRSYMAHHVGMSIIACANLSFGNIFQKRYMSDKAQWSANELLQEKIPVDAIIFEDIDRRAIPEKINRSYAVVKNNTGDIDLKNPVINLISNTKAKILTSSTGYILMTDENKMINYCDFDRYNNLRPFAVMFRYGNEIFSPSKTPFIRDSAEYAYTFTDISSEFYIREKINANFISAEAKYTVSSDTSCYSVALTVHVNSESHGKIKQSGNKEDVEAMLYFEPVLVPSGDYFAHPAFSALSVECEYDEAENILVYKRRPRLESESEVFLAVAARGMYGDSHGGKKTKQNQPHDHIGKFEFESRRDEILPHAYEADDIKNLFSVPFKNTTGACINPVCAVKIRLPVSDDGKRAVIFDIASAKSYEEAVRTVKEKRNENHSGERKETEKNLISVRNRRHSAEISQNGLNLHDVVLSSLHAKTIHNRPDLTQYSAASVKSLWKAGISGDLPIALIIFEDDKKADELTEFLHVYKYMSLSGEKCDFVILYGEAEPYGRPRYNKLRDIIKRAGCEPFLNRKGGIYPLYASETEEETVSALNILASYKRRLTAEVEAERDIISPDENILTNIPAIKKYRAGDLKLNRFNSEEKIFGVEGGYFTQNSFVADYTDKKAPWSHIIANRQFGTCVTKSSLGFTWFSNARERRITPWDNDPVAGMNGERLVLVLNGSLFDVIKSSLYFVISPNKAEYYGKIEGLEYKATVSVDAKLAVKIIMCEFYSDSGFTGNAELCYVTAPVMGVKRTKTNPLRFSAPEEGTICFENICNADFAGYKGFVKALGGYKKALDFAEFLTGKFNCREYDCAAVAHEMTFSPHQNTQKAVFLLGCYRSEKNYSHIVSKFRNDRDADVATINSGEFIKRFMPKIRLSCGDKALEAMFNVWLPYQTIAARIFGRTGFYQSSGAYGFRDQLQDMLCVLYSSPNLVKTHIFRSAAHQFIEGDVLHWWHNIPGEDSACRGVRTRCSDDYLWLAYMVCEYIKFTGDYAILDVKIRYIESEPLKPHEKERYHEPKTSAVSESIFDHCVKAVEYGLNFGSHGLPLIGTCDWNDGMSLVGAEGKGESVWLAFFLRIVLIRFEEICEYAGRKDLADKYIAESEKLAENIELHCYEDEQYIRGFYDDGKKLGSKFNDECKIDLLPQAFAAIAGQYTSSPKSERITSALDSAFKELYDGNAKILKLFDPPFVNGEQEPGYIKGYVAGIRENGGQYTHGAVWGALGFFAGGQKERGYEIIKALNPALRCADKEAADIYKAEPYAMTGDVYSNVSHTGRGGWSWYTGASSWYYKVIAENILGIDVTHGKIKTEPDLPDGFEVYGLTVELPE